MKTHWKTTLKNVSFIILMLQLCFVFGQKKVVVIDVRYDGQNTDAIGINNIQEEDVISNIGL